MKSRLVMLMSLAIAALSVVIAGSRLNLATSQPPPAHSALPSKKAAYLGAYEAGAPPSYQPIANFATAAGQKPNLVGYFSGWAEPFNSGFAQMLHRHDIVPLVQIDPTDALVAAIAAGTYDDYLTEYADAVRDFRHSVVISFGHEMNAPWYSWGYRKVPPQTFVAAWQHIVTLFRGQGADNVTWLWTVQADEPGTGPIGLWWPGSKYVNWVGIDGFYYRPSDTFKSVFVATMDQVRAFTVRPILLSETAVGPDADQAANILNLFREMVAYQTLGLVWFDIAQHGGISKQDWRIEDRYPAEAAFHLGVREDLAPFSATIADNGG
jgi:mannan endo-1,4-beta-mannosidase